jgi:hypothetical protein
LAVNFTHRSIDAYRNLRDKFRRSHSGQGGAFAHHVDPCSGVGLAGLALALADKSLEISMGGHGI